MMTYHFETCLNIIFYLTDPITFAQTANVQICWVIIPLKGAQFFSLIGLGILIEGKEKKERDLIKYHIWLRKKKI